VIDSGDKPVAARGDSLNAASLRSPEIEYAAERRDLDGQVGVLDRHPLPNGGHDLFLQDEFTGSFDEHAKNIEGSRANHHRNENAAFIASRQTLAPSIEAKFLEQKNVGSGEHVQASRFPGGHGPHLRRGAVETRTLELVR
jgi:hypothetical protein